MIIDLHLHSYYSADGACGIQELMDFFNPGDIVAITDHETIGAWETFSMEAAERGLIPVLGVEWFSVKCHILSYFFNSIPQDFLEFMKNRRASEKRCMHILHGKLKEMYADLPEYDVVLSSGPHPENILGLPALASAVAYTAIKPLIEAEDMVRSVKRTIPEGERPMAYYPEEIIDKINSWGALPVLAHPYRNFGGRKGRRQRNEVEATINELVRAGVRGIEVLSGDIDVSEIDHLLSLCKGRNLFATVGSDFHSNKKGLIPASLNKVDANLKCEISEWVIAAMNTSSAAIIGINQTISGEQ
jgi:predicted metal-dependent phosphoesterase TrpH